MEARKRNTIIIVSSLAILLTIGVIIYVNTDDKLRFPKDAKWSQEKNAVAEVERLHPKLRQRFADFFTDVEKLGYSVIITDGFRSKAEQAGLKGDNNSNASAGLSDHEYGFAVDVNIKKDGKSILKKASSTQDWIKSGVVGVAKKHGFKWGGDFSNYHDPIHFYNDFGIEASDMSKRVLAGKVDKQGYLLV